MNWRDIKNPLAGGAELMLQEIGKRLVAKGHEVTQFSSNWSVTESSLPKEEMIEGVKIIRAGSHYTVHLHFFIAYWQEFKGRFDIVIDNFHFISFFTPFFVKEKKIALVCEVAQEVWDLASPWPLINKLGRFFERTLMFKPYRNLPFLTISPSTKKDLIKFGISQGQIEVMPMGVTLPSPLPFVRKEQVPTIIFVGRLAKTKGVENFILATTNLKSQVPNLRAWIIGKGEPGYVDNLKRLVAQMGLMDSVEFLGFVSEQEKFERMGRAHLILVPSAREGWGLIVPEAGAMGTPAVVYNAAGLRDVTVDGVTGIVCRENTPEELSKNAAYLLVRNERYEVIAHNAKNHALLMSWDKTADFVEEKSRRLVKT